MDYRIIILFVILTVISFAVFICIIQLINLSLNSRSDKNNLLNSRFYKLEESFRRLEISIAELKTEFRQMKSDIREINTKQSNIERELDTIKRNSRS